MNCIKCFCKILIYIIEIFFPSFKRGIFSKRSGDHTGAHDVHSHVHIVLVYATGTAHLRSPCRLSSWSPSSFGFLFPFLLARIISVLFIDVKLRWLAFPYCLPSSSALSSSGFNVSCQAYADILMSFPMRGLIRYLPFTVILNTNLSLPVWRWGDSTLVLMCPLRPFVLAPLCAQWEVGGGYISDTVCLR